jgi:hypothetical protein
VDKLAYTNGSVLNKAMDIHFQLIIRFSKTTLRHGVIATWLMCYTKDVQTVPTLCGSTHTN